MIDIAAELEVIHREVVKRPGEDGEVVGALLRRTYPAASPDDVWEAVTDPDRVRRWFMPLRGDLRVGGTFQLEGNAGGEILRCEPPKLLELTFGGPTSLVAIRLTAQGDDTVLELDHTVPIAMAGSGAGALFVGPGWDGGLLALGLYLRGEVSDDPVAAASSPEGLAFTEGAVQVWKGVVESSGTANADEIEAALGMALAQFAPDTAEQH